MPRPFAIAPLVLAFALCGARAETVWSGASFSHIGARNAFTHDLDSTGSVTLTVAPGAAAAPTTLTLDHVPLRDADPTTTATAYDPATTLTVTVPVADCPPGPQYLIARLPGERLIRWTALTRGIGAPPGGDATTASIAARHRDLVLRKMDAFFDADTSGTWLGNDPDADFHWLREDVYYARALFDRGDPASVARANATLLALCDAQVTNPASLDYGLFLTNSTDRRTPDSSVTFFGCPILAEMLLQPPPGIAPATTAAIAGALPRSLDWMQWRFGIGYSLNHTNFQALGICALELGGMALGDATARAAALTEMRAWYGHMVAAGASFEFNSPVYNGVTQWALAMLADRTDSPEMKGRARVLAARNWLDTALHWHPGMLQSAGPYSRAYEDGLRGGTGLTGFLLTSELGIGGYASDGRIAANLDALHSLDINPAHLLATMPPTLGAHLAQALRGRALPASAWQKSPGNEESAYLSPEFSLGAAMRSQGATCESFLLQARDPAAGAGMAAAFARSGASDADAARYDPDGTTGHFALQDAAKGIVVVDRVLGAGEPPRRRLFHAIVADERFGQWQDLRVGAAPVAVPCEFGSTGTVFMRRGGVFAAVRPLYASAAGPRARFGIVSRAAGHLNIAVHALDAAAPVPVAGARLEAALAVAAAEGADWPSYDAFIADFLAADAATVDEAPTSRTVRWDLHGAMEFDFSRAAPGFTRREVRGAPPPGALALGEFAVQPAVGDMALRDLFVAGMPPASWAVYPPGSDTALLVNAADTTATATSNWQAGSVELAPFEMRPLQRPASAVRDWATY